VDEQFRLAHPHASPPRLKGERRVGRRRGGLVEPGDQIAVDVEIDGAPRRLGRLPA